MTRDMQPTLRAVALAVRTQNDLRACRLCEMLMTGTEVAKNINKNNANHAIVFEAIALALALEADTELLTASVGLLGKFISVREPNIKYLGLENMVRLAEVPAVNDAIVRWGTASELWFLRCEAVQSEPSSSRSLGFCLFNLKDSAIPWGCCCADCAPTKHLSDATLECHGVWVGLAPLAKPLVAKCVAPGWLQPLQHALACRRAMARHQLGLWCPLLLDAYDLQHHVSWHL